MAPTSLLPGCASCGRRSCRHPEHPGSAAADSPTWSPANADDKTVPATQVMGASDRRPRSCLPARSFPISGSPGSGSPTTPASSTGYRSGRHHRGGHRFRATSRLRERPGADPHDDGCPAVAYLTVDPNALIGLTSATASDLLSASGFVVVTDPATGPDVAAGVVTGVEPSGQVPAGATLTLQIAPATAPTPPTTVENGKAKKKEKPPKNNDG